MKRPKREGGGGGRSGGTATSIFDFAPLAVSTSCYVDKSGWRRGEDDGRGKRVASRRGRGRGKEEGEVT